MVTTLILVVVILIEAYLAYFLLYTKLSPQPQVSENNSIVRINRTSLSDVSKFLDALDSFQPAGLTLTNPDPFKYSP